MAAEKARIELRIDGDVAEKIKRAADEAGISVNQLVNGIMHWAVDKLHQGEPQWDTVDDPSSTAVAEIEWLSGTNPQPGCVWFGETSDPGTFDGAGMPEVGQVYFRLDFTERRVVRED